jgi:hypothetical protein
MEKSERETVVIHNLADMEEGFVRVYTTEEKVKNKLVKRMGKEIEVAEIRNSAKEGIAGWRFRIPIKFVSPTLGFKQVKNGKL